MRSISVCHVDHDLCRSAQGGLKCTQTRPAGRAFGRRSAPKVHDSAPGIEPRAEPALCGDALRRCQIVVREGCGQKAVERAPQLERGFARVVVAGVDFDHHGGGAASADDRRARRSVDVFGTERAFFASNFPIDKPSTTLGQLFGAYRKLAEELGPTVPRALLRENALRFYACGENQPQ